jgi:hypothetical protein
MPTISFRAGSDFTIEDLGGSGLGFYGNGFGNSVSVNAYQDRTFITDSLGVAHGPECDNVKYYSPTQAILGQSGTPINLTQIPNYQSTLNIRFSHNVAVQVMNAKVRIFDRVNINNGPSGLTCRIAEIIHTGNTQVDNGAGDATWLTPAGTANILSLVDSPGLNGLTPNGTGNVTHDWFLALSAAPNSIGSKTQFALYVEMEYL